MLRVRHSILPLLLATLPLSLGAQLPDDNEGPPGRAGRISSLLGAVSLQTGESKDWSSASLNYTVTSGDRLLTGPRSRAEVEVGQYAVRLADSTDLNVVYLTDHFMQLSLTHGTLRVSVFSIDPDDSIEVDTPQGAAIIRSAGKYRFESPIGRRSNFEPAADFDLWSADRDRRLEQSDCARYLSSDIPGCADLSDNGRWEVHPVYGSVWYPMRVAVGWAPYRYGRWVSVGPWGWTWIEDEPWGYAPFHYGRWITIGSVWAWAPGPIIRRPCYAPALVRFVGAPRYGPHVSIGISLWFPLGPREPYYPWYPYGSRRFRAVNGARYEQPVRQQAAVYARPRSSYTPKPVEQAPRVAHEREQPRTARPRADQPRVEQPRPAPPRVDYPRVEQRRNAQPRTREQTSSPRRALAPRAEPRPAQPRMSHPIQSRGRKG